MISVEADAVPPIEDSTYSVWAEPYKSVLEVLADAVMYGQNYGPYIYYVVNGDVVARYSSVTKELLVDRQFYDHVLEGKPEDTKWLSGVKL